jgi:hypothetical protein
VWLLPLAFAACAYGAVVLQRKFLPSHWGLLVAPFAVFAATATDALLSRPLRPVAVVSGLLIVALFVPIVMTPGDVWRDHVRHLAAWMRGSISTAELRRTFTVGGDGVDIDATDRAGEWVRVNTPPDASLLVRGYEPQVYERARRRWTGRFFWSSWLVSPSRAYRREDFLGEDHADLERRPPDVVVAAHDLPADSIESAGWFLARGYIERARFGHFSALARK